MLQDVGVAQVDRLQVLVEDVGALFGQLRLAQQTVNVLDVQTEQPGDRAHGDHVLGQRQLDFVLGDVGQRHGVGPVAIAFWRTQLSRVVNQDAARAEVLDRVVERLLVEGQQHVDGVAAGAQPLFAEADLIEAVAAFDLGGWNGIGQDVIAGSSGGLSDHLPGDRDTFAGFAGNTDYQVFACHVSGLPPEHRRVRRPVSRASWARSGGPSSRMRSGSDRHTPPGDTAERAIVVPNTSSGLEAHYRTRQRRYKRRYHRHNQDL